MIDHEWLDVALRYVLEELSAAESRSFELHMAGCGVCDRYLSEVLGVEVAMANAVARKPASSLWERVRHEALRSRPAAVAGDELTAFRQVLHRSGVHAACALLNARTSHRFTGVYRLETPVLRNVYLYDREQPELSRGQNSPARETYCSIVLSSGAAFATADALTDPRLHEHPARDSVRSYFGVPLRRADDSRYGTLCHFDLVPREIPHEERGLMEVVAPILMQEIELS